MPNLKWHTKRKPFFNHARGFKITKDIFYIKLHSHERQQKDLRLVHNKLFYLTCFTKFSVNVMLAFVRIVSKGLQFLGLLYIFFSNQFLSFL